MNEFNNGLSAAEAERLAILAEEAAEVIQVVGKILRHGYESQNPVSLASETNRDLLAKELGHFEHSVDMLVTGGDVLVQRVAEARVRKAGSIRMWLHHQLQMPAARYPACGHCGSTKSAHLRDCPHAGEPNPPAERPGR